MSVVGANEEKSENQNPSPEEVKEVNDENGPKHPLQNFWNFWYYQSNRDKSNWEDNLKKISPLSTVEDFWSIHHTIKKSHRNTTDKSFSGAKHMFAL